MLFSEALSFLVCGIAAASALTSTGSTVDIGGISYYLPGKPFTTLPSSSYNQVHLGSSAGKTLVPVTVLGASSEALNIAQIEQTIQRFGVQDDVWGTDFLAAILVPGSTYSVFNYSIVLTVANTTSTSSVLDANGIKNIPPGPYVLSSTGELYQPWRLYSDIEGAFTQPIISSETGDGTYVALPATVAGIDAPGVAVPSRLYYTKTLSKPLAGVRTGIKDIYDIAGLRTSDGNRAFYALYPPRNKTALTVQRLIDAGAILVGKLKTSQFANGELATADWVDYHEPFNPRGDGYQDTSSSSAGSGSAEGSYPWLDITLGSDTGGSIRGPSQVQGIYGNRPTHGIVSLEGVMPLAPELDTSGLLARDPTLWAAAAEALYPGLPLYTQYPKKLQTIGFPTPGAEASTPVIAESNTVLLNFLSKLETFLQTNSSALNYTATWDQTKPSPDLPSLAILLNRTYPTLISKEQTKNVRDPFYADYAALHDGRKPFVDPVPLVRWAYADSLPASELDAAIANKTIFQNWWETHILPPGSNDSAACSDSLILYTSGVNINYRNKYLDPPTPPFGFDDSQISIFAEVPDFVVPLGEAAYESSITNHTEVLPVSVDIIAARGCDGLIFSLVRDLLKAGIVDIPMAGRTQDGGEILQRRGWRA